ncbi:MAG TPA: hypothetical protein VIZ00_16245 [Streptosporangiaceae bacterium]
MSQGAMAAGRLAASVRPGRAADSYGSLIAARLRRLAGTGRTGVLPFAGHTEGALYFSDGRIVLAESAGTPGRAIGAPPDAAAPAALAAAEPIADAALDLVQSRSSPSRFRSAKAPAAGLADGFGVEALLAEIARRQNVLEQLASVVRADTIVVRNPRLNSRIIQVSALQWALLIRVTDGSTARGLAWEQRRSVFGMTIDVYRLMVLRLLSAVDYPVVPGMRPLGELPGRGVLPMSFLRAVSTQNGGVR